MPTTTTLRPGDGDQITETTSAPGRCVRRETFNKRETHVPCPLGRGWPEGRGEGRRFSEIAAAHGIRVAAAGAAALSRRGRGRIRPGKGRADSGMASAHNVRAAGVPCSRQHPTPAARRWAASADLRLPARPANPPESTFVSTNEANALPTQTHCTTTLTMLQLSRQPDERTQRPASFRMFDRLTVVA